MHKSTQQLCLDAPVYTASPHVPQSQGHSAKAASVFCISSHLMGSCSISMEAELKGQVTHWRVMFISFNTEAVNARLQQSFSVSL